MTCGSCPHTDGCCYTSIPPKVKCNITGRYHYYGDECDCKEDMIASKAEDIEKFKELLNKPEAIVAFSYDADKAPLVASNSEEAAEFFTKPFKLPWYGECEGTTSANPIATSLYLSDE